MKVNFESEKIIENVEEGKTILEIALENEIPHTHACGGKGKCSTCRVLILSGLSQLSPRTKAEELMSQKKGLEENIRLACQTRVFGDVKLRRLVRDKEDLDLAVQQKANSSGKEIPLTILFSDIRGYTEFIEEALPYDAIHILNRYFKKMGEQVLKHHGFIDKYIGDGLMAIFGLDPLHRNTSPIDAVLAGLGMLKEMQEINSYLKTYFQVNFEIGIGIHYGNTIVGNIGHPAKTQFTAIGDTVNLASRIESINKQAGTNLLVSSAVYEKIKDFCILGKTYITEIKGKKGSFVLHEIKSLSLQEKKSQILRTFLYENILTTDSPAILRLVFHDAFLRNKFSQFNGVSSNIFLQTNLSKPMHSTLTPIATKIQNLHTQFQKEKNIFISLSDFLAHSSCIALEKVGGLKINCGYGREDKQEEASENFPQETHNIQYFIQSFQEAGFSVQEMIAIMGAHSLGKAHGKYFTSSPFRLSNLYFQRLLNSNINEEDLILLDSDLELLKDEECKKYIYLYARDEEKFLQDFKEVFKKLLNMGHKKLSEELE